jgi:hypothetical protein
MFAAFHYAILSRKRLASFEKTKVKRNTLRNNLKDRSGGGIGVLEKA